MPLNERCATTRKELAEGERTPALFHTAALCTASPG